MRTLKGRITRFLRRRMGEGLGLGRRNNELDELTNCLRRRMGHMINEQSAKRCALKGRVFKIKKSLCAVLSQITWQLRRCP